MIARLIRSLSFAASLAFLFAGHRVLANIINFDDIPTDAGGGAQVPFNYAGFSWDGNAFVITQSEYDGFYDNTVSFPSMPNAAYNGDGVEDVVISRATPFDFDGADFATYAAEDAPSIYSASSVTVTGWNGVTEVGSVTMNLGVNFAWQDANLDGITSLDINNGGSDYAFWLMDNLTYSASASAADSGSSGVLLASALLVTGFTYRRQRAA
jgi:hypothetical protein